MKESYEMERDYNEEETMEHYREHESSLLEGLLDAADYVENEEAVMEISRGGRLYFSFRVHPLSEDAMFKIRKKYTKYSKNRRAGVKVADELDVAKFRCSLIYNSTVREDQEKIWDNKTLWEALKARGHHIINGLDVIEAVLLPGEKERIVEQLDRLGGYYDEEDEEEGQSTEEKQIALAKN